MDLASAAIGIAGTLAAGGGVWTFLSARSTAQAKAPADLTTAQAAFQLALNAQAETFMQRIQGDRDSLQIRVDDLSKRILSLEQENAQCRSENDQMGQRIESLEAHLRRKGIDIPSGSRMRGLTVMEDGKTTVFSLDAEELGHAQQNQERP